MKIALIIPKNISEFEKSFYDYKFFSKFLISRKYFSYLLAIPTLASLTPPEHEIRVFDENIEDIDYDWGADLAGISLRTMFSNRAYDISWRFRQKGVKTVLGGIHPSMRPEEALQHCDTVVIGEAEEVWQQVLLDAKNGALKRTYEAGRKIDLKAWPGPRRSVLSKNKYFSDIVQTTKGCPFHCEFCSVYAYDGKSIRSKSIGQVIREIEGLAAGDAKYKKKSIFFADDNIISDRKFARELFPALKPYRLNWSCQASINIAQDDELLRLMKDSGCGAILIGFESVSEKNLSRMDKKVNLKLNYKDAIKKIQSYGILVHGSFILGYDFDTEPAFDELIDFIEETMLLMPLVNILTPFPGTKLFSRFDAEGRIIHKDWSKYDAKTVVFSPSCMTAGELQAGYRRVIKRVYSFDSILRKLNFYWNIDFWKHSNEVDPIKFKYRLLFAVRLFTLIFSFKLARTKFIIKILPKLFDRRVRVSTILTLMAYNDYAYTGE
ncbi:MAG: B12-binding domain-containing radical SAM protein [Deltaproteobacteria bacterium]|nr:B12-binding domain-containing radical SAM protein [Deltaproteobacteria bacterium]